MWSSTENRICFLAHSNGLDDERDVATGRLIAAAPDLQGALLPFTFCNADTPPAGIDADEWRKAVIAAREALAKSRATAHPEATHD